MEKWEKELETIVNNQPIIIIKKHKRSHGGLFLIVFLLLMAIVSVYAYKKVASFKNWVTNHFHLEKIDKTAKEILDNKPNQDGLLDKISKLEEELKKNSKRIGVLGIGYNENFSILSSEIGKDFIILNHDWTMSRQPKNLIIQEDDKGFVDQNSSNMP